MGKNITEKSPADIALMQQAGRIVESVLLEMQRLIKPSITTKELDEAAAALIKRSGARASFFGYSGGAGVGFPGHICASINEEVVHGIPGKRKLRDGDIISIDVGAELEGYHGDAARTFFVGDVAPEVQKLVRVTRKCFFEGANMARVGNHISDISKAVQACAEAEGYGVVRVLVGHGIGRALHEEPDIPNYFAEGRGRGAKITKGMTIAIEPMINLGTYEVRTLSDRWTVVTKDGKPSAHYENTLAVTDEDPLLLTLTCEEHGPEVEYE